MARDGVDGLPILAQLMEDRRSGVAPPCVVTSSGSPAAK
jgi:hypothetical protein